MMTGEMTTIARPYANAAFEYALARHQLPEWEAMLFSAATFVEQNDIKLLLANPDMSVDQLVELMSAVLAKVLNPETTNFIRLLAENKRLPVLPDIAALFAAYRAEHEKTMNVEVISAIPLNDMYQDKLAKKLAQHLQRRISLACKTDPTLLGGAVIRAGDNVIDGSVRGKLNRLFESL